ncbi:LytR/AlgR family response regulator transcription factor [Cellulosilyticum ruminicola]|uniref:LytR/AlgR family response regulator transcription factor n=1 Tax=Cellulosilyticum ruminicola TaxID=425254 RepID=UPI0006CFF8CE|nr:LytTR family DNA-binding domain-containing protein [Cellulosilyticum ruminicola]
MLFLAICDDDKNLQTLLLDIIKKTLKSINRLYEIYVYDDGESLLKEKVEFDIIFLDIGLKYMNGIEVGKNIRNNNKQTKIIYVTSYSDYRANAFSVHAFQYIIKPFKEEDVQAILMEAISYKIEERNKEIITLETDKGIMYLETDDIYYFEYEDRHVNVICKNITCRINARIKDIINKFSTLGFGMPHKSFVVNLYHISRIRGYDIEMKNGVIIPLAQKQAVIFKQIFNNYLQTTFNFI